MRSIVKILPSVMCCRLWEIKEFVRAFEEAAVEAIHFDVMDGHYVKNIMLGTNFYRDLCELTSLPVDLHFMCEEPEWYLDYFSPRKGDWVSFHPEASRHPYRLLQDIRGRGLRAGLALNPGTPVGTLTEYGCVLDFVLMMAVNPGFAGQTLVPDHLEKLRRVHSLLSRMGLPAQILVDGNTTPENARKMCEAGADGLVVGTSSLLSSPDYFKEHHFSYIAEAMGAPFEKST